MSEETKFVIVKKRDAHSKWARTGEKPGEDVFLEEKDAISKVRQYKKNVPSWRFAYIVAMHGKVDRVMEVV